MLCLERLLDECVLTNFSCVQSLVWPFTQEAQPDPGEVSRGGDKTDANSQVGKQASFFPIYRHIIMVLTDIISVSI